MSSAVDVLKNLDRRVTALESERLDDTTAGALTSILKLYADVDVEVTLKYWVHTYRKCGDAQPLYGAVCGTDTYL